MSPNDENPIVSFWRLYYSGSIIYDKRYPHTWDVAPAIGVQAFLNFRKDGNMRVWYGKAYYWHDPDGDEFNRYGATNDLNEAHGKILSGSWVSADVLQFAAWEALLDERDIYHPNTYDRAIPPMPEEYLFDFSGSLMGS